MPRKPEPPERRAKTSRCFTAGCANDAKGFLYCPDCAAGFESAAGLYEERAIRSERRRNGERM